MTTLSQGVLEHYSIVDLNDQFAILDLLVQEDFGHPWEHLGRLAVRSSQLIPFLTTSDPILSVVESPDSISMVTYPYRFVTWAPAVGNHPCRDRFRKTLIDLDKSPLTKMSYRGRVRSIRLPIWLYQQIECSLPNLASCRWPDFWKASDVLGARALVQFAAKLDVEAGVWSGFSGLPIPSSSYTRYQDFGVCFDTSTGVLNSGDRLSKEVAEALFPQFAKNFHYHRG